MYYHFAGIWGMIHNHVAMTTIISYFVHGLISNDKETYSSKSEANVYFEEMFLHYYIYMHSDVFSQIQTINYSMLYFYIIFIQKHSLQSFAWIDISGVEWARTNWQVDINGSLEERSLHENFCNYSKKFFM